jgi:PucR C-terminal helix-turn-helix domain/GGDEF-like domain
VPPHGPDPLVARIAARLLSRLEPLADEAAELLVGEISFYRAGSVVDRADLTRSVRHNIAYILGQLASAQPPNLTAPRQTGRQRARQGAPLPEILRAYRLGFGFLWGRIVAEARACGAESLSALLDTATSIWELADDYALALTDAYRQDLAEQMITADRRRSALVAALLSGPADDRDTAWEIAKLLGFPYDGCFLLVAAEAATIGAEALPGLEDRLRGLDVATAFRSQPGYEVAVLSCGHRRQVEAVTEAVRAVATARAGISPEYARLDGTPRAMRFAHVALESLPAGSAGARRLDDTPIGELVMSNLDVTRRIVRRILRDVLTLPDDERSTLLTTAQAWLDSHGSAAAAGRALFCHENTVRYRMHRLEGYLGRTLDDPAAVAELATALQAVRIFPELG